MRTKVALAASVAIFGISGSTEALAQTADPVFKPLIIPPAKGNSQAGAQSSSEAAAPSQQAAPAPMPIPQRPIITPIRDLTVLTRAVPIRRQLPIAAIRAIPKISLGNATVNFTPVLQNPAALFNVANRLRDLPQLTKVERDETDIVEIDEGLLVRSALKYTVKPGACSDPASRARIEAAGNACFRRGNGFKRLDALANPASPNFIADPGARADAIAQYQATTAADQSEFQVRAAEARGSMADPASRAALVAKLGAAEAERVSKLTEDQLIEEMVNAGEVEVEQVLFVPKLDSTANFPRLGLINPMVFDPVFMQRIGVGRTQAIMDAVSNPAFQQALEAHNARNQPMSRELGPYVFLTGFTLGKHYEWQTRVQYKVDPCRYIPFVDSCKKTYYLEPYAKLGYGFGLRFPVKVTGQFSYPGRPGETDRAKLTLTYRPINGSRTNYQDAGLDQDKLFEGKELVAEFEATAGFRYKVPFKQGDFSIGIAKDFTDGLPAPFRNGQFTPPVPGAPGINAFNRTFTEFDLLGGQGNYGFAGVTVYPAIRIDLESNKLELTLTDRATNRNHKITASGQARYISVDDGGISKFAFGNPVYNLSFKVTPGIEAHAFVDVAVWEKDWNWPVWFPEIGVELPPGGVDFACHSGTRCMHSTSLRAWRAPETAHTVRR